MKLNKLSLIVLALVAGCGPSGPHKPVSGDGKESGRGKVGYDSVRPVFANQCAACHPSRSAPDWLDYSQAVIFARSGKLLRRVVTEKSMPPPGSAQAASITEQDRSLIAEWVKGGAPLTVTAEGVTSTAPTNPNGMRASKLVLQCLNCHGSSGPGAAGQPKIPRLAGQNEKYMIAQLHRFKWRERIDPGQEMNDVAADLEEEDILETAKYFSGWDGLASEEARKLTGRTRNLFNTGRGYAEQNCVGCHMNREYGNRPSDPRLPLLAGQSKKYLVNQLIYFRDDERANPLMREMAKGLNNDLIEALAVYFSEVRH